MTDDTGEVLIDPALVPDDDEPEGTGIEPDPAQDGPQPANAGEETE